MGILKEVGMSDLLEDHTKCNVLISKDEPSVPVWVEWGFICGKKKDGSTQNSTVGQGVIYLQHWQYTYRSMSEDVKLYTI